MRRVLGLVMLILSFVGILYGMKIFVGDDFIAGGLLFLSAFNMGLVGVDMTMLGLEKGMERLGQ